MGVKFETTNWSLIVRARGSTTEGRRTALAGLCDAYWYPLYSFARRRGCDHEDASDLTQAFFLHLIEKHAFEGRTPAQGRLRAFLLASFKHFQSDERQRSRARKRGGDLIRIPWDDEVKVRHAETSGAGEDPEQHFAHQWALTVIHRARLRLRAQYADAGRPRDFDVLSRYLAPEQGEPSTTALARTLATTEGNARVTLHRFRRRFATALRTEVASTVENPEDPRQIESELQFLLATLSGKP
jgi:DNA-directed RNA polymerase specialized sigma24 family protein